MYKFELHLINMDNAQNETITFDIDETPVVCNEKDIFICAMSRAYDYVNRNEKYLFDSLEFISC